MPSDFCANTWHSPTSSTIFEVTIDENAKNIVEKHHQGSNPANRPIVPSTHTCRSFTRLSLSGTFKEILGD